MSETQVDLVQRYVRGRLSRRQFILRGLELGLSLTALDAIIGASDAHAGPRPTEFNVIGWGGAYKDALDRYVNRPFEAANGIKVLFQAQALASASLAKIQAEKARPTVDVWLTTTALPLLLAKAGALQELTVDKVTNLKDIYPLAVQNYQGKAYGVGIHLQVNTIVVDNQRIRSLIPDYNVDMLKSWRFLYRPELKNNIGISGFSGQYGAHNICMTKPFGGSETNEEAFFAAMKRVAPNVHVIKTGAIGYDQLFLSKEIVAASAGEIDATSLLRAGAPVDVGYPTDPLSIALDYIVAIKNGPAGSDLALKYVNEMVRPVVMAPYANQIGTHSLNRRIALTARPGMPTLTQEEVLKGWVLNYEVMIQNFDAWNERYRKEIVPLFGK